MLFCTTCSHTHTPCTHHRHSYPLDVDFNGAPISLLERDRQIGEWFYIRKGEDIRIFSATTDKFETISWDDAKKADVRRNTGDPNQSVLGADDKTFDVNAPILIFRPFQTWRMASALLLKSGSDLGNTFHGHHDMQLQNGRLSVCYPFRLFVCSMTHTHTLPVFHRRHPQDHGGALHLLLPRRRQESEMREYCRGEF